MGIPGGYLFIQHWLQNFAYKIEIKPDLFVWAGIINILLVMATMAYHSIKVSEVNPVETLRNE